MSLISVLIAEKDPEMRQLLAQQVRMIPALAECKIDEVSSGPEVLEKIQNRYQLLMMDSVLPDFCGIPLIKKIRETQQSSELSILIITADQGHENREKILASGAQVVLEKPFDRSSFAYHLKQLLEPVLHSVSRSEQIKFEDLVLDTRSYDVFCAGNRVHLTPHEFSLLKGLMLNPGEVLSRDRLIQLVQGAEIAVVDRAIDTHVFSLRKKLGTCGALIETVRSEGYRLAQSS